ncbi:Abi family protein [Streptomyces somaliensis]|uniref:Abi family protein n=1 Tax=Streptomyces somaliensis TaxID=78355 RepID=UPI0020CD1C33|nr:Abi family protein [Streptomyces somaliensis]MCP9945115.1 Abi family protein [Streptomyces somaliensis]MCP9961670.1 Abi family protein [Streptomyces somaliensis]MCP9974483.1 Abi family protein [Streptomyces somaliensis]
MTPGERETDEDGRLVEAISPERFRPFLHECRGHRARALRLYAWDSEVARALQSPLRDLEVGLRNRLHRQLAGRHGQEAWWDVPKARPNHKGRDMLDRAMETLESRRPYRPFGPCDVVAQLSFGFWVSLIGRGGKDNYEMKYWNSSLRHVFREHRGGRDDLYRKFQFMLTLRNRIAHHERVFQRHLEQDLATALTLLRYVSPEMADRHEKHGRVPEVLARREAVLSGREPVRL